MREDDGSVRMYKDNPDMMKKAGPGGLNGLTKKAQQDVKKAMKEAADYPHMMYDPKSGKKVIAKTPDDHDKYAKMGYTHEKPKMNEISMGKMQAYGKAAAKDIDQKRNKVKAALDQPASVKHAKAGMKAMQGLTKRSRGSDMYVDKMTGRSKVKPTPEANNPKPGHNMMVQRKSLDKIMKMIKK